MNQPLAGRYQFESEIARGAAGVVHRARDLITGETVAIKVLHTEAADEPVMAEAFLDEAEVLSELNHPGIVRPRDLIVNGDVMALVMDLVEGTDLRRRLAEGGPLSPAGAAQLGAELSQVLSVIHDAGIVHGDVKPGNIMLPHDGGPVRLIDFGVARRVATTGHPTHGTPDYVAPEIVAGEASSAKADVYGIGLVLFEALCGRNPYRGGSIEDVLARHRSSLPVRPDGIPIELWSIIELCLAEHPGGRPEATALPSMLRAVKPLLSDVAGASLLEPPVLRPRPVSADTGLHSADMTPTVVTPPSMEAPDTGEFIDAILADSSSPFPSQEPRKRRNTPILVGAVGLLAIIVGLGFFVLTGFPSSPGLVSEPNGTEESPSNTPTIEETDTDSPPSQEPSEEGAEPSTEPSQEPGDSNGDGGMEDDSGDASDPGESEGDFPGEDLIGSPMPGSPGGN